MKLEEAIKWFMNLGYYESDGQTFHSYANYEKAVEVIRAALKSGNFVVKSNNRCVAIRATPNVEVKPVMHALWKIWNSPGHKHVVECSDCKVVYYEDDLCLGGDEFPNYCPNCGAKMEVDNR